MDIEGFILFITDLRGIETPEEEANRVQQEFAKIRQRFNSPQVSGYEMRKNVWKLIYCHMLGYDVDFGYMEIISLIASDKYHEKLAGYMGFSVLLSNHDDLIRLCINSIQDDISSGNENFISLALSFIACTPSFEISERLYYYVIKIIDPAYNSSVYLKKKAFLALSQILNISPSLLKVEEWVPVIENILKNETNESSLITAATLMNNLFTREADWDRAVQLIVEMLLHVTRGDVPQQYMYHVIPAPWLTVKFLHLLTLIKPKSSELFSANLSVLIMSIFTKPITQSYTKPKRSNALTKQEICAENIINSVATMEHAIKLEALNVAIIWRDYITDLDYEFIAHILDSFITSKSTSVRFVGLEMMSRLSLELEEFISLKEDLDPILKFLQNDDSEVRKQAAEILYNLCDKNNWNTIIPELLATLRYSNSSLQKNLVLKIATITEKYAADTTWYIDTIFNLIDYAPDVMVDNIWHRIIWWLSGVKTNEYVQLQKYAANRAFSILRDNKNEFNYSVAEPLQKLCGYLVGEFGVHLSHADRLKAYNLIKGYFVVIPQSVKCIYLLAIAKFGVDDKFRPNVLAFLRTVCETTSDIEVQTRAFEMLKLLSGDKHLVDSVLNAMPKYPKSLKEKFLKMPSMDKDIVVVAPKRVAKTIDEMLKEKYESQKAESVSDSITAERLKDASNEERWKMFLNIKPVNGLYYVDKYVTISLNQSYKRHIAKIQVIVQNSSPGNVMDVSSIYFPELPSVVISQYEFQPASITENEKTHSKATFKVMQPFVSALTCNIIAKVKTPKKTKDLNIVLDLPFTVNKLISPLQLKATQFANLWNSIHTDGIVNTKLKTKEESIPNVVANVNQWLDLYISKTNDTIYGSATMSIGDLDENNKPANIPCVIMMKLAKSQIILEVRSTLPIASKSLAHAIRSIL